MEIQGTGEAAEFDRAELNTMLDLAEGGLHQLIELQQRALNTDPASGPVTL